MGPGGYRHLRLGSFDRIARRLSPAGDIDIRLDVAVGAQQLGGRIAAPPRAGGTLRIFRGMREDPLGLLAATGQPVRLAASFGVASYPDDARDLQGLLALADQALFAAKGSGRDGIAAGGERDPAGTGP